jgi:hypothetical protein
MGSASGNGLGGGGGSFVWRGTTFADLTASTLLVAAGGGGGGFSGGGGGGNTGSFPVTFGGGGGGGSLNNGTNQVNTAGVGTGDGKVIITFFLEQPFLSCEKDKIK